MLLALEPEVRSVGDVNSLHDRLFSSNGLVYAVRIKERRTLAKRDWQHVTMSIGNGLYKFYFRDILRTNLDCLRSAANVELAVAELERSADGERLRSHTMHADLYLGELANVLRIHGRDARQVGIMLHLYEAVMPWNGAA